MSNTHSVLFTVVMRKLEAKGRDSVSDGSACRPGVPARRKGLGQDLGPEMNSNSPLQVIE